LIFNPIMHERERPTGRIAAMFADNHGSPPRFYSREMV
jgi:hypothetical protein